MFVKAYKTAAGFTRPVIISTRTWDGTVESGCGAFILLNEEGWLLTAGHLFNSFLAFRQHGKEMERFNEETAGIKANGKLNAKQKKKKLDKLAPDKKWITHHSFWWGADGMETGEVKLFQEGDLAICRIKNFKRDPSAVYPVFKNPAKLDVGSSLCRLGYPFHGISAVFDEQKGFVLAENSIPLPLFPIEGIYTRNVILKNRETGFEMKFLETSSPGLRGQSGGPIFDREGRVWAIQSRTQHFPLGFSPFVEKDGKKTVENQFLNVGWGVHPEMILQFLRENRIKFQVSD